MPSAELHSTEMHIGQNVGPTFMTAEMPTTVGIDHVPGPPSPVDEFVMDFEIPAAVAAERVPGHNLGELAEFRTGLNPTHNAADASEARTVDGEFDDRPEGEQALLESIVDTGRFALAGGGVEAPPSKPPRRRWTGLREGAVLQEQPQVRPSGVKTSIPGETDDTKLPPGDHEKSATSQLNYGRLFGIARYDLGEGVYDIDISLEDKESVDQADIWLKDNCTVETTIENDGDSWLGEKILTKVLLKEDAILPGGDIDDAILLRARKTLGKLGKDYGEGYVKDNSQAVSDFADKIYDTDPALTGLVKIGTFKAETGLFLMTGTDSEAAIVEHNRDSFPGLQFDEASKNQLIAAGQVATVFSHKDIFEAEGATVDTAFARHILDTGETHDVLVVVEHCAKFPDLHIANDDLRNLVKRAGSWVSSIVLPRLHNMRDVTPDVELMKAFCDKSNHFPQFTIQQCLETGLFEDVTVSVVRDILSASQQGLDEKEFVRILAENFTAFDPHEAGTAIAAHIEDCIDAYTSFTKLPAELQSDIFKKQLAKKGAVYLEHYSDLDVSCLDGVLRTGNVHSMIRDDRELQEIFIGVDGVRLHDVAEIMRMSRELYGGPNPEQTQKEYIKKFLGLSLDADQDAIYASVDIRLMSEFTGLGQKSLDRVVHLLASHKQDGLIQPEFFGKLDSPSQELIKYIASNVEGYMSLRANLVAYLAEGARNQSEYKSDSITGRLHTLQNLARNGLLDVAGPAFNEHGWPNTNKEELIGIILKSSRPEDALREIQQLVGEGVLLFGGQSNSWLQGRILRSDQRVSLFHEFQQLESRGLFELGGKEYNGEVLNFISSSENVTERFAIIASCVEQGLFNIGNQINRKEIVNYVLESEDLLGTMAMVRELSDRGLFVAEDSNSRLVSKRVLQSKDPLAEHDIVRELEADGLFTFGGEYNSQLVDYVCSAADMRKAFVDVRAVAESGVLNLGSEVSTMILSYVLRSDNLKTATADVLGLVDRGLLELGGAHNQTVLRRVLSRQDATHAFEAVCQLIDNGLSDLEQETSGAFSYVLGSSDPEAGFDKAKQICDKTAFLRGARRQYKKADGTFTQEYSLNIPFYAHADQWLETLSAIPEGQPGEAIRTKMIDRLFLRYRMANLLTGSFEYLEDPVQAVRLFTELAPSSREKIRQALGPHELELMRLLVTADSSLASTDSMGTVTGFRGFPSTKPDKLKQVFLEEKDTELYSELYKAKIAGSDELERFLEGHPLLKEQPQGDMKTLSTTLEKVRLLNEFYRREPAAATAWLNQYGAEPIKAVTLLAAWQSRPYALTYRDSDDPPFRVADNPKAISDFAAQHGVRLYAEEQIRKNATDLTSEELMQSKEWLQELGGRYDIRTTFNVLQRTVRFKREHGGIYPPKFIAPEKTTVTYEQTEVKKIAKGGEEIATRTRILEAEVLPAGDPRAFTIGYDTGCCMTVGGVSESCIWSGQEDPRYAFFAVYDEAKRLRAQSIMYIGEQDGRTYLVFDNIEVNAGTDLNAVADVYKRAMTKFIEHQKLDIDAIHIGEGYVKEGIIDDLPVASVAPQTPRVGTYSDAHNQRVLWDK